LFAYCPTPSFASFIALLACAVEQKTAIAYNQKTERQRQSRITSQSINSNVNRSNQGTTVSASGITQSAELSRLNDYYKQKEEQSKQSILSMSREGRANIELKSKMDRLNDAYKQGIITKAQYNKISKEVTQDMKESSAVRNSAVNNLVRHIRQIETMIVTLYLFSAAWRNTLGAGVEFNKVIENNSYGLAALISSNTDYVNSQGKVLSSGNKFIASLELSKKTMLDIKNASKETSATFPELTQVFQQAFIPPIVKITLSLDKEGDIKTVLCWTSGVELSKLFVLITLIVTVIGSNPLFLTYTSYCLI